MLIEEKKLLTTGVDDMGGFSDISMEFIENSIIIECRRPQSLKDEMNLVTVFLYVLLSIWQSFRSEGGGYKMLTQSKLYIQYLDYKIRSN